MKAYCNCLALDLGLDPVGHAGHFDDAIVIETPLPWKSDLMQKAGALPQPVLDLLDVWVKRYYAGEGYPHLPMVVAPDPQYSRDGYRRVMLYTRPSGGFARFDKAEYLVPVDEVGVLVWSLYQDRDALPRFEPYRITDDTRDILVCTHGTVDAACAKFGFPLYKHMRETYADLRVWRVSHFGGHVFAPTLIDMPSGHYWAYLQNAHAAQIVQREGDVNALRGQYRGWAGLPDGFQQVAEFELWQRHGWRWFDYRKSAQIIAQDTTSDAPQWADVRICYAAPDDVTETVVEMRVEITHTIETVTTTGQDHRYAYPQYRVVTPSVLGTKTDAEDRTPS